MPKKPDIYKAAGVIIRVCKSQRSLRWMYSRSPNGKVNQRAVCEPLGIEIEQVELDITEIQSEDGAIIALDKAKRAFGQIKRPVVVTDDSWIIPGLRGFPGPYMKYINHWFTPEDFLRLTKDLDDRRIFLKQVIAYYDSNQHKTFDVEIEGRLLTEIRGGSHFPHFAITTFDKNGRSAAELNDAGQSAIAHLPTAWHDLCDWLKSKHPSQQR